MSSVALLKCVVTQPNSGCLQASLPAGFSSTTYLPSASSRLATCWEKVSSARCWSRSASKAFRRGPEWAPSVRRRDHGEHGKAKMTTS
eukprot:10599679-Alexandrium_andersonii.AAC.1